MDFAFSPEQEMLRSQARSLLQERLPLERIPDIAQSETGWDAELYKQMAELGWTGLSVAEDYGGAGMTFLDEAVVFEELGYALVPAPYFSTVALALPALTMHPEAAARVASGEATATLAWAEPGHLYMSEDVESASTKATRSGNAWRVTGEKVLVPDLQAATLAAVVANSEEGAGIWLVDLARDGVSRHVSSTMDATRRFGRLELSEVEAEPLVAPRETPEVLEKTRLRALAALSLEAIGIGQRARELATEHAQTREQFGKPIGTYQAVSHQISDSYMEIELARSLSYWAAWCVAEGDPQGSVAVPAAKAAASDAAVHACERSIQVHGGIGFTWEHILHRFYKRAQWIEAFEGFGPRHRAAIAGALLEDEA